jgi:hypothetical protein
VIVQNDSTTLILAKHFGKVDAYQNILIYPNGYEAKAGKTNGHQKGTARKRQS